MKKNYKNANNRVKLRYSTRKFSVGLVSVLIGMSIFFGTGIVGEKLSLVRPVVAGSPEALQVVIEDLGQNEQDGSQKLKFVGLKEGDKIKIDGIEETFTIGKDLCIEIYGGDLQEKERTLTSKDFLIDKGNGVFEELNTKSKITLKAEINYDDVNKDLLQKNNQTEKKPEDGSGDIQRTSETYFIIEGVPEDKKEEVSKPAAGSHNRRGGSGSNSSAPTKTKEDTKTKDAIPERLSGKNRIETAIKISQEYYKDGADTVILVNAQKQSDILAVMPYSKVINAPVLYTNADKTPEETIKEIKRLGAKKIVIVGGENSISSHQEILNGGFKIDRINGKDRYETASLIADRLMEKSKSKNVIVVSGDSLADALAVSPLALKEEAPILLVSKDKVSNYTLDALNKYSKGKIYISGGENTVSANVENTLKKYTQQAITRFAGVDRYETAVKVAKMVRPDAKASVFASGQVFADALVSGPVINKNQAPILLVKKEELPATVKNYLKDSKIEKKIVIGGENSVSKQVVDMIAKNK